MSNDPDNLVYAMLREMRAENLRFRSEVLGVMDHLKTVMTHLERSATASASASEAVHLLRADMAREFQKMHSDVLHLENQNMSRHGETMAQLRRIETLEQAIAGSSAPAVN